MLHKLSSAARATATALSVLVLCAFAQLFWLRASGEPAYVVWLPVIVCGLCTWLYVDYFVRVRFGVVLSAFARVADGELDLELPPPPDADVAAVRESLMRMMAALRNLTERLKSADAARRRLFADLSHELATPSSTIVALIDALAKPELCPTEEQKNELVRALAGESARLVRLVNDMRDLGQLDDPDFRLEIAPTDLAEVVNSAVQRWKRAHPACSGIVVSTLPVEANVDHQRVEQILFNLLTNASRYVAAEEQIRVSLDRDGEVPRIVVEDAGPGVPDEMLSQLGERLLRVDPSRSRRTGGSGLGLSIVRAIVGRHGGKVQFDRSPLGGLRVTVLLPEAQLP
jgi:two-component system sensor histidine kinase BaeS